MLGKTRCHRCSPGDWDNPRRFRDVRRLIRTKYRDSFPSVDIRVNNLGTFEPKAFEDIPDEDWRRFFEVNVLSGVRLSRAYLPGMKDAELGAHRFHQQ